MCKEGERFVLTAAYLYSLCHPAIHFAGGIKILQSAQYLSCVLFGLYI